MTDKINYVKGELRSKLDYLVQKKDLDGIIKFSEDISRLSERGMPNFKMAYEALESGIDIIEQGLKSTHNINEKNYGKIKRNMIIMSLEGLLNKAVSAAEYYENIKTERPVTSHDNNIVYAKKALLKMAHYDKKTDRIKIYAEQLAQEFMEEYNIYIKSTEDHLDAISHSKHYKRFSEDVSKTAISYLDKAFTMYELSNNHNGMVKSSLQIMKHGFKHGLVKLTEAVLFYIYTPTPHEERSR